MSDEPVTVTITPANPPLVMVLVTPASIPVEVVALLEPVAVAAPLATDPLAYYILAKG